MLTARRALFRSLPTNNIILSIILSRRETHTYALLQRENTFFYFMILYYIILMRDCGKETN